MKSMNVSIPRNNFLCFCIRQLSKMNLVNCKKQNSRMWLLITPDIESIMRYLEVGVNSRIIYVGRNDSEDGMPKSETLTLHALIHSFYENNTQLKQIGCWTPSEGLSVAHPANTCCENVEGAMLKIATIHVRKKN